MNTHSAIQQYIQRTPRGKHYHFGVNEVWCRAAVDQVLFRLAAQEK